MFVIYVLNSLAGEMTLPYMKGGIMELSCMCVNFVIKVLKGKINTQYTLSLGVMKLVGVAQSVNHEIVRSIHQLGHT